MYRLTIQKILLKMGITAEPEQVERLAYEEGEGFYNVWKLRISGREVILKEAKGCESAVYKGFFPDETPYAPTLLACAWEGEREYLLLSYFPGEDLRCCTRGKLRLALDSLVTMQQKWWNCSPPQTQCYFDESLARRKKRRNYLKDSQLETAYDAYLEQYCQIPRTLCHDDLLPFNILCDGNQAIFIDWECGGILPYPTSLARLIAHCEESESAFFYMTEADRSFAIDTYYHRLLRHMDISLDTFLHTLKLFVFYEYCEWIYVGNYYHETNTQRFQNYLKKAKALAADLGY